MAVSGRQYLTDSGVPCDTISSSFLGKIKALLDIPNFEDATTSPNEHLPVQFEEVNLGKTHSPSKVHLLVPVADMTTTLEVTEIKSCRGTNKSQTECSVLAELVF
jgi:hypothetical protein